MHQEVIRQIEETVDNYEKGRRRRLVVGILVGSLFLIAGLIGLILFSGTLIEIPTNSFSIFIILVAVNFIIMGTRKSNKHMERIVTIVRSEQDS